MKKIQKKATIERTSEGKPLTIEHYKPKDTNPEQ